MTIKVQLRNHIPSARRQVIFIVTPPQARAPCHVFFTVIATNIGTAVITQLKACLDIAHFPARTILQLLMPHIVKPAVLY